MTRALADIPERERRQMRKQFVASTPEYGVNAMQAGWSPAEIALAHNVAERDVLRVLMVGVVPPRLRAYLDAAL